MSGIKIDEFEQRIGKVKELEIRLSRNHMQRGYICGLVNGLRLARGVISGENVILEREEAQVRGDIGSCIITEQEDENGNLQFVIMKFDSRGELRGIEQV